MRNQKLTGRGGAGRGQGRPPNKTDDGSLGKGFATRVLGRIRDLKLDGVGNAEEYALNILKKQDAEAHSFFRLLLAYKHGKPVQPVITADTRENAPSLDFGNLAMPAAPEPRTAGKPN